MMKKADEMREEYDFSKGVRGKHANMDIRISGSRRSSASKGEEKGAPLRCPFCGDAQIEKQSARSEKAKGYRILCVNCGASGPLQPSPREAFEAWNERR